MNALLCLALLPAAEPTVDTRYLRDYAETRGFMLGRPAKPQADARRQGRPVPALAGPHAAA